MKKLIFFFALISFSACTNLIIDDDEPITPINNFEIFWNDFNQHYSLFTIRNINWNNLYEIYRPQINETTSDEELWNILSNLIEQLDDSHTVLFDGNGNNYHSGYALNKQSTSEFSKELLTSKYLDLVNNIPSEDGLSFGKIKNKNIGYIYLGTMDGENPSIINSVINELKDYSAIILDVRQNTGGDDKYSSKIAQAFSDGKHFIYTVQTRNGINHDDFDNKKQYHTYPNKENSYVKPVIVLTDRKTISAGEIFLLHMKSFKHIVQIGDTTAGDFSTVSNMRFLPNSWHYNYSIQKFLLPNGESLDGIGHIPDVYTKNNKSDITSSNDKVIEKAIQYLFDEYKIE
ncbi:S41 family peptidase [Lutibacter citreus]|uniref:S41 family peptidase n=1 Tax=Lutibacter citreus TaxID=2138210 RepID=UPI000DBE82DF|nr:S41 family peptidase [Lutibacter citreus]